MSDENMKILNLSSEMLNIHRYLTWQQRTY